MAVRRYRTRPIELEAVQCTNKNLDEVKAFAVDALVLGADQPRLMSPGGSYKYVHWGDWIGKDTDGFRLMLTRDITEWFEEVSEQEPPTSLLAGSSSRNERKKDDRGFA